MSEYMVEVKNLCKYFPAGRKRTLKAVDNVSFYIRPGETLGLVGESGCGKTTCGRTLLKLYDQTSGQILFKGQEISHLRGKQLLSFKKNAQMIFQDPYSALDPRMTIAEIIAEGMGVHMHYSEKEKQEKVNQLLVQVNLTEDYANRFVHELSGGQRQRIGIARALAVNPEFIVCDEPISALDVSIQAQVINMFEDLQEAMGLTYLFIAHDLSAVKHISNRIGVMYLGRMVELADSYELITRPLHPYTKSLISAIPIADPKAAKESQRIVLEGDVPSPLNPPSGCRFRTRCPYADEKCAAEVPAWRELEKGHFAACHHIDKCN